MAPGMITPQMPSAAPYNAPGSPGRTQFSRNFSIAAVGSGHNEEDYSSETVEGRQRYLGQRATSRKSSMMNISNISNLVYSIKRRSSEELGTNASSRLFGATHESLLEWISAQRMSDLPPEGSSYDKVLAWAQLFVDRLHSFDHAIQEFAGDSYLAAQLAYGYCSLLLELGKENARALMVSFGFFYSMSVPLVNLLERTELFSVSQEIREQLVLALSDLVTLVASVSTYFHKAIRGLNNGSISVNIYSTFPTQIKTFLERCEKTAESMWRHQLQKEGADSTKVVNIKTVRSWIAPEDHVLSSVVSSTSHLAHDREELTCLYIGTYLTRFLKGSQKTMSLSGPPGSGKTVLASVIVDYLQHPIAGVTYNTLFVPINARIPSETTSRAIAKSLLYQLFQKRTGNVQLLNILTETYERSLKTTTEEDYDNLLWTALGLALGATLPGGKDLIVVVDGLDECSAGEDMLYQCLQAATTTKGATAVKLITLGGKTQQGSQSLQINEDLIFDDIMAVVRDYFEDVKVFQTMDEMERETLVARITTASKGSFVWAKQASKQLRRETTAKDLFTALDKISKCSVPEFVHRTLTTPDVTDQTRMLLTWLVTAERPLSVKELATLASINVDKQTVNPDVKIDVMSALKPVNSLVYMQEGLTYMRHATIRKCVIDCLNEAKGAIKDRHGDLAIRLLVYINSTVTGHHDPSMTVLDTHEVHQLTSRCNLLDFAIRYWPLHLRKSFAYLQPDNGDSNAAKLISRVVPRNLTVILLQAALWEHLPTTTLLTYHTMMTNITRQVLTTKDHATLQSMIFLSQVYQDVDFTPDATTLLYEASTVSNTLLTSKHTVTMQICQAFIDLTSTRVTTTKTDVIMTHREQVLQILVECYKTQYGQTSEYVVTTMKLLVEHYRMIKEETKAQQVITTIRSISSTTEFGSDDTTVTDKEGHDHTHLDGDLQVNLRGRTRGTQDGGVTRIELNLDIDETDESIEGHGAKYDFEFFLVKAERYLAEGKLDQAEHTYVDIWQRTTREYRLTHSLLWEERRIRSVVCYARFLTQQKRTEHARSVLSTAWEEYRSSVTSSSVVAITDSTASLYLEVASMMKAVGMSSESLTLMKHCSQFLQSTNKTQTSAFKELQQNIQTTSREVVSSVNSTSTSTVSETMLEEMVLEQSSSLATVEQSTFTATYSLVHMYISQHRWQDSTRLLKQMLRGLWPSLFSPNVEDVVAPQHKYVDECVTLAEKLAECYHARRRRTKEEDIRVRVYRAMRGSRKVDDKLREKVTTELIQFLRRTEQGETLITTRQEMLDDYTAHYGPEHPSVIKMLWELAELTRPRPVFVDYYQKIIKALHKTNSKDPKETDTVTSPECFEPFNIVATELYSKGHFTDALPYYRVVFSTFLRQPKTNPKLQDPTFVKTLFERYTHCLRSVRSDFTVIHRVSVDYQKQCKTVFTMTSSITIQATLHLAKVCQESRRYEMDAVHLYEELLKVDSKEIDRTEICAILDSIYEEQADLVTTTTTSTSRSQQSVSSEQVQRALKVLKKRVATIRETHGWAHEESLSKLSELVRFYSSQTATSTQEETARSETILRELREATVHILTKETSSSSRLIAAASTIASSYVQANQIQRAVELKQELYNQIIIKATSNVSTFGFDLTTKGRESLVFLAQFEHTLQSGRRLNHHYSLTVTDILAELTTQYIYFADFRSLVKASQKSSFSAVITSASRLHVLLTSCDRKKAADGVFHELVTYFLNSPEGNKRVKLASQSQITVLMHNLLRYFSSFRVSRGFLRSVGISGIRGVEELLKQRRFDAAADLATATFAYIASHDEYRTDPAIAKLVLVLGLTLADGTGVKYIESAAADASQALLHGQQQHMMGSAAVKDHSPKRAMSPSLPPATQKAAQKPAAADLTAVRGKLLSASAPITRSVLHVLGEMKINLESISIVHLNRLIGVLGAQRDHETLSWLLTILWESREAQRAWPANITLALGRRYIMARYLVGDTTAAVRLAEDIVYNCKRVHGSRHPRTLDMSVFLTQLYTGIAGRYHKISSAGNAGGKMMAGGGQDMAARYYKKSVAVHENILRVFSDPTYAEMEGGLDGNMGMMGMMDDIRSNHSGSVHGGNNNGLHIDALTMATTEPRFSFGNGGIRSPGGGVGDGQTMMLDGDRVRLHFQFLKLAVQRLGAWPKDYKENYERLNADIFREFGDSLKGVEGVEKWDLSKFGGGKAESDEDVLDIEGFKGWELFGSGIMGEEVEEEL